MKALIIGITGQDGSYLAELLLSKGYEVHGIVRRASSINTKRIDHIGADKSWSSSNYLAQHKAYVEDIGKVEKPWGWFKTLRKTNACAVKELHVNPGECLSLQRHKLRKEKWLVVSGTATVTVGDKTYDVEPGEIVSIGKRTKHRLENKTQDELVISEWWLGNSSEADVERFEDKYGRCGQDMD